jgi:3-phenylpropionate/trans-cinnamate dioxygenase ferredoxin reductase subunit
MSVVIIGAGHSGVAAATALRKLDKDIKITLISNEDNLPYQRPPLSKKTVFSETPSPDLILGKDFYNKNDINLHTNSAVDKINPEKSSIILFSKDIIEYEQLIIATGTKRHELKVPGEDLAKTLYSIKDAQDLSKSIAKAKKISVIGGGFIGCEIAAGARKQNKEVTLLEAGPSILSRSVAPIFAQTVSQYHNTQGINILTNCKALSLNKNYIETTSSNISTDLVIAGIGVTPNIKLAIEANLEIDNGVLVNEYLQTSNENIFAIGDIANFPFNSDSGRLRLESIQNANEQAKTAAKNVIALRHNEKLLSYSPVPWFWSDQGDLKLQMVGVGNLNAKHHVLENQPNGTLTVLHFIDSELVALDTLNHGLNHICGRKLLAYKQPISIDDINKFKGNLKSLVNHLY